MTKELQVIKHLSMSKTVTRQELVNLTGLTDRAVRETLETLKREHHIKIHSSDHGKGYKLCSSKKDVAEMLQIYDSRIETQALTRIALSTVEEMESHFKSIIHTARQEQEKEINDILNHKICVSCGKCTELQGQCVLYGVPNTEVVS
jgi:hypothetical protein